MDREIENMMFELFCTTLAEQKQEFEDYIEDWFYARIAPGKQQNDFEWSNVKKFFNDHKDMLRYAWTLKSFCSYVFKLFSQFTCEDHHFVMKIIYMYHELAEIYKSLSPCYNCMEINFPRHYHYEETGVGNTFLRLVNNVERKKYDFTNRTLYSNFTIRAILHGDYVLLQFLVKYALSYFPDNALDQARIQIERLYVRYCAWKDQPCSDDEYKTFVESTLSRFVEENRNLKRTNLIINYVIVSIDMRLGDNYYVDYVDCLKLFTLTLPESMISLNDLEDFLDSTFKGDRTFISETCSSLQDIFPECPSFSTPRTLKHLCRCAVRDYTKNSPSFPAVVSNFEIPKELKTYLLILSDEN